MSIEFHHFFQESCNPYVNTKEFEFFFRKEFRYVKNAVGYMIHQPFVNSIVDVNIDLLLIIAVENKNKNFYPIKDKFYIDKEEKKKQVYLNNIVLPIKFIDEFKNNHVEIYECHNNRGNYGILIDNNIETDYSNEIIELKIGTEKFLKSNLETNELKVIPIIWILSNQREKHCFSTYHIIQAYQFGFYELDAFLRFGLQSYFKSIPDWAKQNITESYQLVFQQMEKIKSILQDSSKISPLTKQKIDRIALQHHKDAQIYEKYLAQNNNSQDYDEIFSDKNNAHKKLIKLPSRIRADKYLENNLVIIQGRAGSGKTTELLLLMKKQLENNQMVRYLTYNKLLSLSVYKFKALSRFQGHSNLSTQTIHSFMYNLGKTMGGVVFIMGQKRIQHLTGILERNIKFIEENIISKFFSKEQLKEFLFQNRYEYRHEIAEFNEFKKFLNLSNIDDIDDFNKKAELKKKLKWYKERQIGLIQSLVSKDVFLSDYYGVLSNIYLNLTDAKKFYNEYEVDKIDSEIQKRILKNKSADYNISNFDEYQKLINRSRGAYSRHIPVIDEGQDFHPLERDILFEIFKKKNMIVATGGKEQLIRHQLECDWTIDNQGRKHNTIVINKRNKSYRLKQSIADLCNYLAKKFEINLDLETDNQEQGHLIISSSNQCIQPIFDIFCKNGEANQLNPCESVYLILEAESSLFEYRYKELKQVKITENSVAVEEQQKIKSEPDLSAYLNIKELNFYYANMGNSDDKEAISNHEYLVSFYESCRGLESWSVMCFELDKFYERKKCEEQAMNFLSDLYLTEDEKRQRYAMTWVLMALTRAMDGLFIHIDNPNSELGKILIEYSKQIQTN